MTKPDVKRCADCECDNPTPNRLCRECTLHPLPVRYPNCEVVLVGTDGNAFAMVGVVQRELRHHLRHELGWRNDQIEPELNAMRHEAMGGDYDSLLATLCRWVVVV